MNKLQKQLIKQINFPKCKQWLGIKPKDIKPFLKEAKNILKSNSLILKQNKSGYLILTRKDNPYFFTLLDNCGFFQFHCTNFKQQICCLHQVSLYLYTGYNYFLMGCKCPKDKFEVHHLDHNVTNNSPSNLIYVTSQENAIASSVCRLNYNGRIQNSKLGSIKNPKSRLAAICKLTFEATFKTKIKAPLANWLLTIPSEIGKKIIQYWTHIPPQLSI
jgi:hypothetical protein